MKRTNLLLNIISVAVLAALVLYISVSYVKARGSSLKTVQAVSDTAEDLVSTEGYAVREETALSNDGNIGYIVSNGTKVAEGQMIAEQYSSVASMERADEIRSVRLQIEQLESDTHTDPLERRQRAMSSVEEMTYAFRTGQTENLDSCILNVRANAFDSMQNQDEEEIEQQLQQLLERLAALEEAGTDSDTGTVSAPCSGVFYSAVDGYESIDPAALEGLTPSGLEQLMGSTPAENAATGKIVTGICWYYATTVEQENAERLAEGDTVQVRFVRSYSNIVSMTVEYISPPEDGRCALVLRASTHLSDTVGLRQMTGQIIFSQQTGLRLPREAIHLNEEGNPIVYTLVGAKAAAVQVELLAELENGDYLVSSGSMADLHEGSEVIVQASDLYDGKVVVE